MGKRKKTTDEKRKYCEIAPKECDGSCGCKKKKGGK